MSKIDVQSFRVNNDHLLRVRLNVDSVKCEKYEVKLQVNRQNMHVLSTSKGIITRNNVISVLGGFDYLEVFADYPKQGESGECFVSFQNGDELVHSESLKFDINRKSTVTPLNNDIEVVKTLGMDFESRMKSFVDRLSSKTLSKWSAYLSVDGDITVQIKAAPKTRSWAAFGEKSNEILATDILLSLDPDTRKIIIPIEAVWVNFDAYDTSSLYLFELVQADFHNVPNVYYKTKISNAVNLDSIPRIDMRRLEDYQSPTGEKLTDKNWQISESGLPVNRT